MAELCSPAAKTYAFKLDDYDNTEHKQAKGTKKCLIKKVFAFENYKESTFKNKNVMTSQLRFKSDSHNVYTKKLNKIAICNNDDKRLQTFASITTYQYGTSAVKVCESEMLAKIKGVPIPIYYEQANYLQYLIDIISIKNKSQYFGGNICSKNSKLMLFTFEIKKIMFSITTYNESKCLTILKMLDNICIYYHYISKWLRLIK